MDNSTQSNAYVSSLTNIASGLLTTLQNQAASSSNSNSNSTSSFLNTLGPYGWIVAGNYYRVLLETNSSSPGQVDPTGGINWNISTTGVGNIYSGDVTNAGHTGFMDTLLATGIAGAKQGSGGTLSSYDQLFTDLLNTVSSNYGFANSGSQNALTQPNSAALSQAQTIIGNMGQLGSSGDPLSSAVGLGLSWMNTAVALIMIFSGIAPAASFGANFFDCMLPFGAGVDKTIAVLQPFLLAGSAFLYMQGALLGFYLPMVPVIIFMTSSLGWLISAIEAMVAAPLIALGLAWPEAQSEVLGRAEPAVMLILNLFLRPALMVAGFIFGLVILTIALKLTNFTFSAALHVGGVAFDMAYGHLIVGIAYCALVLTITTRCFNLIHQVPDKILTWIGDQSQNTGGADDALGAAKGGAEKGAQGASSMHTGAGAGKIGAKYNKGSADNGTSTKKT